MMDGKSWGQRKRRNNVRKLRREAELTQTELATRCGVTQQKIQRIETSSQIVDVHTAIGLAKALGVPLEKVFPGAAPELRSAKLGEDVSVASLYNLRDHEKIAKGMLNAGISVDVMLANIIMTLKNGLKVAYSVSPEDNDRLWKILNDSDYVNFVVFDTFGESPNRVVINRSHIVCWRWWTDDVTVSSDGLPERQSENTVKAVLDIAHNNVVSVECEPDSDDLIGDENCDAPLQAIIFELESSGTDNRDFITLRDDDGDYVNIVKSHLSLLEIPLSLVVPKLTDAEMEGYDENVRRPG